MTYEVLTPSHSLQKPIVVYYIMNRVVKTWLKIFYVVLLITTGYSLVTYPLYCGSLHRGCYSPSMIFETILGVLLISVFYPSFVVGLAWVIRKIAIRFDKDKPDWLASVFISIFISLLFLLTSPFWLILIVGLN